MNNAIRDAVWKYVKCSTRLDVGRVSGSVGRVLEDAVKNRIKDETA